MDLIGPLPLTSRGNQYVLTMTCYFSKWVEAYPIPSKSATNVAQAIYAAYCRHGAPVSIITDQGREFVNQVCVYDHYFHRNKNNSSEASYPKLYLKILHLNY